MAKADKGATDAQHMPQLVGEVSASTAGALIGIVVGGPIGAIAGAAAGPLAKTAFDITSAAVRARAGRVAEALNYANQHAIKNGANLEDLILQDDDRLNLAINALDAAASTTIPEKIAALGNAVGQAALVNDSMEIQRINLVVRALAEIEPIHLRALKAIAGFSLPDSSSPEALEATIGLPSTELRPIVRRLELLGLISDEARFSSIGGYVQWRITELGTLCLQLLTKEAK